MKEEKKETLEQKALRQLLSGESLFGKDGAFAPMLQGFLDKALEAEMEEHLSSEERSAGNKRNGKGSKTVKSSVGTFEISTPQDRHSSFAPEIIKKRQTILADSLSDKIIGLYGIGMSYSDIQSHIKEMYDTDISSSVLTDITDRIIPDLKAWQSRPLDEVYCIVWLDAMHYKVREEGKVVSKAIYTVLGVNVEGRKEVLGMYVSEAEGANFWLGVLTDIQHRGVKDILIVCVDNLKGFSEAISSVFVSAQIQKCIVHQIRNSLKFVASKNQREFMKDLKLVYRAVSKDAAELALDELEQKWGPKYPMVIESWKRNWNELSTYFEYAEPIRRIIYTTNTVEGFHRQVRKVTKTKGAFTSNLALQKLIYLAIKNIEKKWTSPLQNWGVTIQQLYIKFGDRVKLKINPTFFGGTPKESGKKDRV